MVSMIKKKCKNCKTEIEVRFADHKRGWGNFCSKRCKAVKQSRSGGSKNYYRSKEKRSRYDNEYGGISVFDRNGNYEGFVRGSIEGWDDHK